MPTVLLRKGWRVYFFANEGQEPIHVHCKKGGAVGKFWLLPVEYQIKTAYVRRMTAQEEREIKQILYAHFDEILEAWRQFEEGKNA